MTQVHRIPNLAPRPDGMPSQIRVRARTERGEGEPSPPIPFRPIAATRQRQIRGIDQTGRLAWVDTDPAVMADAIRQLLARTTRTDTGLIAEAAEVARVSAEVAGKASSEAVQIIRAAVIENDGDIEAISESLTQLQASLANYATATALQALTTRVVKTETGITTNAAEITALEAAHGGRTLGPVQNIFTGDTKAAAAAKRDTYQAANAAWLAQYDADNDINIELQWGVLYVYQRRLNGAWVDNGEALARAAAVTGLNARVVEQGGEIDVISEQITRLIASIGTFTASAYQQLLARVTNIENVGDSRPLGPARNQFSGSSRAAAIAARNTYAAANPRWLADYDYDESINIQLNYGGESIYQNRRSGIWRDNEITLGGLARWLVKTRVGDIVAGVGLYNDGTNPTEFIVQADRVAIVPPGWTGAGSTKRVPFNVINGIVYLDVAAIRDGSITNAAIRNATISNAKIVSLDAAKINAGFLDANRIEARSLHGNRITAGSLTATEISNAAGLIRSQRVSNTIAYANGATATDYDYEVTRLISVSISNPTITFNTRTLRVKNSDPGLSTGAVKTTHIAPSATAEIYGARLSALVRATSTTTPVTVLTLPSVSGGAGYRYMVTATAMTNKSVGLWIERNGVSVTGDLRASTTSDQNVSRHLAASGSNPSDAVFRLRARRVRSGGGSPGVWSAAIEVALAKR